MISLSALLTSLGVMSQQNQNLQQQQGANNNNNNNNHQNQNNPQQNNYVAGGGGLVAGAMNALASAAAMAANQNSAAEGSMERGSCLLRYASQNSLDESSQKHIQRPNSKDRCVGQYHNELHTTRSFEAMNEMRNTSFTVC